MSNLLVAGRAELATRIEAMAAATAGVGGPAGEMTNKWGSNQLFTAALLRRKGCNT